MQGSQPSQASQCKKYYVTIVSAQPLMCEGLKVLLNSQSEKVSLTCLDKLTALTPELSEETDVVVAQLLDDELALIHDLRQQYAHLRWLFIVPASINFIVIEKLMSARTSLFSAVEPKEKIISQIFNSDSNSNYISPSLLPDKQDDIKNKELSSVSLTFAERRVLRLISKGWRINQIATLLEKNHKTISTQKTSALRRLSLRSDAEMYAWMASEKGMRELNLPPFSKGLDSYLSLQSR